MKNLLILLASLALFACGGSDSGGSTEEAVDAAATAVEEAASDASDVVEGSAEDLAQGMHDAVDAAEDVGDTME